MKGIKMVLSVEKQGNEYFASYTNDYPVIDGHQKIYYPLRFIEDKIMIDNGVDLQEIKINKKKINAINEKEIKYIQITPEFGQPFMVPDIQI